MKLLKNNFSNKQKKFILLILLIILIIYNLFIKEELNEGFEEEKYIEYEGFKYSPKMTINDIKNIKEGQKRLTLMMKNFNDICIKHNIKYWCIGGTLIGALRHKGWVPWDGDLDVSMTDTEYKKLKLVINNELDDKFEFTEPKNKICSKIKDKAYFYKYTDWALNQDVENGIQLDIFIVKKENNKLKGYSICGYPDKGERDYDDIFPLKQLEFEGFKVYVPNKYEKISKELWKGYPPSMPGIDSRYPHEGRIYKKI